jgi:hypothetical protein
MTEKKKFYILGDVFHQDDTNPIELLGEVDDEYSLSGRISGLMNQSFPPKHIFVIEGVKHEVSISGVSIKP